jgi:tetratricopeptide (TPR) repeat protein
MKRRPDCKPSPSNRYTPLLAALVLGGLVVVAYTAILVGLEIRRSPLVVWLTGGFLFVITALAVHCGYSIVLKPRASSQGLRPEPAAARPAGSEAMLRKQLADREAELGPDHPEVAQILYNLANISSRAGRRDEAETLHRRALAIREASLGPEHRRVAQSLRAVAEIEASQGRHADAFARVRRALAILDSAPAEPASVLPGGFEAAAATLQMAEVAANAGRFPEAEKLYRRAWSRFADCLRGHARYVGPDPNVYNPATVPVASFLEARSRPRDAEEIYRKALEVIKRQSSDPRERAQVVAVYSEFLRRQGRADEARALEPRGGAPGLE